MSPFTSPIWLAGLVWLFRRPKFRPLAWIWVTVLVILVANGVPAGRDI